MFQSVIRDLINGNKDPKAIGILTDRDIKKLCLETDSPMISPFVDGQVKTRAVLKSINGGNGVITEYVDEEKIVSYGLSSMGYDVRLANKFKIFTNVFNALIDPLNMPDDAYIDHEGDYVIIPPNSYILGHTVESFNIPPDILSICFSKSTWARAGCLINLTPLEPGWCAQSLVLEISNLTPLPLKLYSNMGIAQLIFLRAAERCDVSYADRGGKYQHQKGVQTAIV